MKAAKRVVELNYYNEAFYLQNDYTKLLIYIEINIYNFIFLILLTLLKLYYCKQLLINIWTNKCLIYSCFDSYE